MSAGNLSIKQFSELTEEDIPQGEELDFNDIIYTQSEDVYIGQILDMGGIPVTVIDFSEQGTGVIYQMIDEYNNDCPYDFKNIQFIRKTNINDIGYYEYDENGTNTWLFTFAANVYDEENDTWSELLDGSLESPYMHCSDEQCLTYFGNIIKPYVEPYDDSENLTLCGLQHLNNIVFIGYYNINANSVDNNAACSYCNIFEMNCYNNTFGNKCFYNNFGLNCSDNIFNRGCSYNIIGSGFRQNIFDHTVYDNIFGNECNNFQIGNTVNSIIIGNHCNTITIDGQSEIINIGSACYGIKIGYRCRNIVIGNNCSNIKFGGVNTIKSFYNNIIIEQGNTHIYLDCGTTTSNNNKYQNIKICQGVNGDNSNIWKTIVSPNINQNYQTVYKTANDLEINV